MLLPKIHIKIERWKYNKEHELWVSTLGNFKTKSKKEAKVRVNPSGYKVIKDGHGKQYLVHRIVMQTWRPLKDYTNMTVDHLDSNKRNNELSNLQWVTGEENRHRADENKVEHIKTVNDFRFKVNNQVFETIAEAYQQALVRNLVAKALKKQCDETRVNEIYYKRIHHFNCTGDTNPVSYCGAYLSVVERK